MTRGVPRSRADVERAAELLGVGVSAREVARLTGIPWTTIKNWRREGLDRALARAERALPDPSTCACRHDLRSADYALLLGLYLGDGCLVANGPNALRLTISCDAKYPGLIEEAADVIGAVTGRRGHLQRRGDGCVVVHLTSMHWRCLFPQHGPGKKHDRAIELAPWQVAHVEAAPHAFIRGLLNSDGCRVINAVKGYRYVRYHFTNHSADIRELFRWACWLIGVETRMNNAVTFSVARRASVELLDGFVGPKH